jgi:cell division protein FtsB
MATRTAGTPRERAATPVGVARGDRSPVRRAPQGRPARRAAFGALRLLRRGATLALVIGVLSLFAAGVVEQRWKESQLREQVAAEQAELQAAQARQAALKEELAGTSDEATARRQLNLAYPGETVYLVNWTPPPGGAVPSAQPVAEAAEPVATKSTWQKVWHFLVGE